MHAPIRVIGEVNEQHQLVASVPTSILPGKVKVLVLISPSEEDDAGAEWEAGIAREWHADLADPRQDIYSLADGVPLNEPR